MDLSGVARGMRRGVFETDISPLNDGHHACIDWQDHNAGGGEILRKQTMANPIYDSAEKVRAWRSNRGTKIGSSDIAPILGLSPYRTALEVYAEKVAALEAVERDNEPQTQFDLESPLVRGHLYEPVISRAYELRYDCRLEIPESVTHPEFPHYAASPDRKVVDAKRLVELKKVSRYAIDQWGEPDTGDAPDFYILQAQWQCAICAIGECDIFALVGDDDFRRYPIQANHAIAQYVFDAAADFWAMVLKRQAPEPDWNHPATPSVIAKLRKPVEGVAISLPDECQMHVTQLENTKQYIKVAENERDKHKAKLIHAMGDAAVAHVAGYKLTRKTCQRKAYSVDATDYIDFRVSKPKTLTTVGAIE